MLQSMATAPLSASSISLSLSNISAVLAGCWNCKAKGHLIEEMSEYFAALEPDLMTLDYSEMEAYDAFLRKKVTEAVTIRDCAETCSPSKCRNCKFC